MRELSVLDAAREAPNRDFLVTPNDTLSYADVAERVRRAMTTLTKRGVAPGARVAFSPEPDVDSVVWLLALFELGCPAVLLHPRLSKSERDAIVRDACPALVLESAPPSGGVCEPTFPGAVPDEQTLAVVFTSGSSGRSRGVLLPRRAFVASFDAHTRNLGWLPSDRWLLAMPPAHVGGLSILTRCLIARAAIVLDTGPFEVARTIHVLESHRVSLLSVVPTMLHRLLESTTPRWEPSGTLRAVLVGGAGFPDPLRRRAVERGAPALGTYGLTEACSQVATQRLAEVGNAGSGAPLVGVDVRIREGEIQVSGPTLMSGYLDAEDDAAAWTDDGWLRTRDAGRFADDGALLVHGRLDHVIVTGGENVAPEEVESVLASLPGVVDSCVFGLPHEEWGEEVVAVIVTDGARIDAGSIKGVLGAQIASFKHPKRIAWVDTLPLNRNGKVDRRRVRAQHQGALEPM